MLVWSKRKNLSGSKFTIKEDFPQEVETRIKTLTPILQKACTMKNTKATLNRDILVINGSKYTVETMSRLPSSLQPNSVCHKEEDDRLMFFGEHSVFSNFNRKYPFSNGLQTFCCNEQFYVYSKATFFKDDEAKKRFWTLITHWYTKERG